jgi:hypothetical protein
MQIPAVGLLVFCQKLFLKLYCKQEYEPSEIAGKMFMENTLESRYLGYISGA